MKLDLRRLRWLAQRAMPFDQSAVVSGSQEDRASLGERPWAFSQPIHAWGQASYHQGWIYLDLQLSSEIELLCSRCLTPVKLPIRLDQRLVLREEPPSGPVGLPIEEFSYPHGAKELDLLPYLRGLILNSLEAKYLCKPDCQGLCPRCGHDLNQGRCNCPQERRGDPRLAALKELLP